MKRIINWLEIIKAEISPSILSGLVALSLIFFLMPSPDGKVKMTLINVLKMGILCLFSAAVAYYAAITYSIPYPFWASVIVATFAAPVSLGVFKLTIKFSKDPEKTIKRNRK